MIKPSELNPGDMIAGKVLSGPATGKTIRWMEVKSIEGETVYARHNYAGRGGNEIIGAEVSVGEILRRA